MESTTERLEVRKELTIAASPETVWQFLVDPDKTLVWWGQKVTFDARPGGQFRIDVQVVLEVTGLVHDRAVVIPAAARLDHHPHVPGGVDDEDRGTRRLVRPRLDIQRRAHL